MVSRYLKYLITSIAFLLFSTGAMAGSADSSPPSTTQWTFCANENSSCLFTGTQTVRYGAGSSWVTRSLSWNTACNNSVFGDPLPGTAKHCEVTSNWTFCANENGQCSYSGAQTIRYGAGSTYVTQTLIGGAGCNNGTFGDPLPGTGKHCDIAATTWTYCAGENGYCSFSGTKAVLYGANGNFTAMTLTGGAGCNNGTFGDPASGWAKSCYLPGVAIGDVGGGSSGFVVSEAQFNQMFPGRNSFYTYQGLVNAAGAIAGFASTGSDTVKKQEAAAFLANVAHETGGLVYIEEIDKSGNYCDASQSYGCPAGTYQYYGRGPLQVSWNFNYKAAGDWMGTNLLNTPSLVASDATISWKSAIWYWMTQNGPNTMTAHYAMINSLGFGQTIKSINGSLECNGNNTAQMQDRINYYNSFVNILGVPAGSNLSC